ncbi:MAG: CFI-box-CTERM domain-containing protein [Gammaproteobacteria bacterium]
MGKSPKDTGGPIVKTGPTAGKNRSRNKDGQWRQKRSDSGKSKKSGGLCFLSTAACQFKGLPDDCHELEILRAFRDNQLLTSDSGCEMVEHYYSIAPEITKQLNKETDLEHIWRVVNKCVIDIESKQYQDAIKTYKSMVEEMQDRLLK